MTQRIRDYPVDLLTLASAATAECGCDPDWHDTVLCECGHRIVDHNPRAPIRPCEKCPCRAVVRRPHPPVDGVPVEPYEARCKAVTA